MLTRLILSQAGPACNIILPVPALSGIYFGHVIAQIIPGPAFPVQVLLVKPPGRMFNIRLQIPGQVAAPVMNIEPFYEKVTTSVPYREVIEKFIKKFEVLYPKTKYVNRLTQHSWGQKVIRFYDPDVNLIEVGTPM